METQQLNNGDRLADRFELVRKLGESACTTVWLANDTDSSYPVALKIVRADKPECAAPLQEEWRTLRALNHPHIVRVFDFFDAGPVFFAQYLIDGLALESVGRESWQVTLRPLLLICRALEYLHDRDIAHGDLSASNILVDRGGAPFLIDFGCARRGDITVGLGQGTPAVMSPERRRGAAPSTEDDMFALVVLMNEALAAGPSGDDRVSPAVPDELRALIGEMLGPAAARPDAVTVLRRCSAIGVQPGPLSAAAVHRHLPLAQQSVASALTEPDLPIDIPLARRGSPGPEQAVPARVAQQQTRGVRPALVWGGLVALLVVFAGALKLVPQWAQNRSVPIPRESETPAVPDPEPLAMEPQEQAPAAAESEFDEVIEFSENIDDDSNRSEEVRRKNATDRKLGELLTKQEVLETRSVERWAAERYGQAIEAYRSGDRFYLAGDYLKAHDEYSRTVEIFDELLEEVGGQFDKARVAAEQALQEGDSRRAERLYETALAITPNDAESQAGLERAQRLDEVLALTDRALASEAAGDYADARDAFGEAVTIDSDWQPATDGLVRVQRILLEQEFRARMTAGFAALDGGRVAEARSAFDDAAQLIPESPEPRDGLLQVDQAVRLAAIGRSTQAAREAEAREDWQAALGHYRKILEQDSNVVLAQDGVRNAQSRIALDGQLQRFIDDPDALADEAVLSAAAGMLPRLATISPQGPRLQAQKAELSRLLKRAAQPITVQIVSDAQTDVALFKIGRLGQFERTAVDLRPGVYTAVGSRPGFKDVRVQFRVSPEADVGAVVVRCEEPI